MVGWLSSRRRFHASRKRRRSLSDDDNSALEDFATEIESDATALRMVVSDCTSTFELAEIVRQQRAYDVVAVMKQRIQHLEESYARIYLGMPLVSQLPEPSARLPSACAESPPECAFVTNGKKAMRPSNTVSTCATAVKAVLQMDHSR